MEEKTTEHKTHKAKKRRHKCRRREERKNSIYNMSNTLSIISNACLLRVYACVCMDSIMAQQTSIRLRVYISCVYYKSMKSDADYRLKAELAGARPFIYIRATFYFEGKKLYK